MLKIRKILGGLIKSSNEKELEKLKFYVNKINELEPYYKKFSLDQFAIKTTELRSKLEKKIELDDLLPDAFASSVDGDGKVWAILRGLGRSGPRSIALGSSLPWLR